MFTRNYHTHTYTHIHTPPTMYTQGGLFPLIVASHEGHDRIVEILLQAGATVDLKNKVENCSSVTCNVSCAVSIVH